MERYKIDLGDYPNIAEVWLKIPYARDLEGFRKGSPSYAGPPVYGRYLRGTLARAPSGEILVLPLNPFWIGDWTYKAGQDSTHSNPRPMYNLASSGYISPRSSPSPQDFHAAWGPQGSDCSDGGNPDCAYEW